ncbi:MAG: hypothetical protein FWD27_01860 [Coriobacteriia bacterium]|nr:hypothetical protein [Coriobacteriia bacterium]
MSENQTPQSQPNTTDQGAEQENVLLNFDQDDQDAKEKKPKKKKKRMNPILVFLIWVVVIVGVIILALVISAWIAPQFNNVFELVDWIANEARAL